MHYYKRNIGDYHKKAGRLSILEHGAYTLLLDAYYDRERPPTLEDAIDWCWATSNEEIAAVKLVLSKFFTKDGEIYRQSRIDEELEKFHNNSRINSKIAKEREEKRRKSRARTVHEPCTVEHEPPPNHKPLTTNHKEKNSKKKKSSAVHESLPTKKNGHFKPPSVDEVKQYCEERNKGVDPELWWDFYQGKGWMVGKSKMKDWKAAVRTWERGRNEINTRISNTRACGTTTRINHEDTSWDIAES